MEKSTFSYEFCSVRFSRQLISKNAQSKVEYQNIHTVRYLNHGRLGVAISTDGDEHKILEQAKECSKVGLIVGDDFFTRRSGRHPQNRTQFEQSYTTWLQDFENVLKDRFYEANCSILKTNRNMLLKINEETVTSSEIIFYQYGISVRTEKEGKQHHLSLASCNDLLGLDTIDEALLLPDMITSSSLQSIKSRDYEILFSPKSFNLILDLLFHSLNPQLKHLDHLLVNPDSIGEQLFSSAFTIDQEAKGCPVSDDEGNLPTSSPLIQHGVLNGNYNDQFFSQKYGQAPTGNGYRNMQMFSPLREGIPFPQYPFAKVHAGKDSLDEMISGICKGIIIEELSKTFNHDFLVAPIRIPILKAWLVENGKIIGSVANSPVVYAELRQFFQLPFILSNQCQTIVGREIPWVYTPALTILNT